MRGSSHSLYQVLQVFSQEDLGAIKLHGVKKVAGKTRARKKH